MGDAVKHKPGGGSKAPRQGAFNREAPSQSKMRRASIAHGRRLRREQKDKERAAEDARAAREYYRSLMGTGGSAGISEVSRPMPEQELFIAVEQLGKKLDHLKQENGWKGFDEWARNNGLGREEALVLLRASVPLQREQNVAQALAREITIFWGQNAERQLGLVNRMIRSTTAFKAAPSTRRSLFDQDGVYELTTYRPGPTTERDVVVARSVSIGEHLAVILEIRGADGLGLDESQVAAFRRLKRGMPAVQCFRMIAPILDSSRGFEGAFRWLEGIERNAQREADIITRERDGVNNAMAAAGRIFGYLSEMARISGREIYDIAKDLGVEKEQVDAFNVAGLKRGEAYAKIAGAVCGDSPQAKADTLSRTESAIKRESEKLILNLAIVQLREIIEGLHQLRQYGLGIYTLASELKLSDSQVRTLRLLVDVRQGAEQIPQENLHNALTFFKLFMGERETRVNIDQLKRLVALKGQVDELVKKNSPESKGARELNDLADALKDLYYDNYYFRDQFVHYFRQLSGFSEGDCMKILSLVTGNASAEGDCRDVVTSLSIWGNPGVGESLRNLKEALRSFVRFCGGNRWFHDYVNSGCLGGHGYTPLPPWKTESRSAAPSIADIVDSHPGQRRGTDFLNSGIGSI